MVGCVKQFQVEQFTAPGGIIEREDLHKVKFVKSAARAVVDTLDTEVGGLKQEKTGVLRFMQSSRVINTAPDRGTQDKWERPASPKGGCCWSVQSWKLGALARQGRSQCRFIFASSESIRAHISRSSRPNDGPLAGNCAQRLINRSRASRAGRHRQTDLRSAHSWSQLSLKCPRFQPMNNRAAAGNCWDGQAALSGRTHVSGAVGDDVQQDGAQVG